MNIIHIRSLCQQLAAPQFTTAHAVVDWMGMVQAQDNASFPWAVGLRMKHPSLRQFRSEYDAGRIIRTHLFRQTWQLVTAEDLSWMQLLYGQRGIRGDQSWARPHGWTDEKYLAPARAAIIRLLETHHHLSKERCLALLNEQGLSVSSASFTFLMRRLEYEGLICSGPWHERFATFALQAERVPQLAVPTREEALAMLARKYFRSHAPATLHDFVWWTNLPKGDCQQAIDAIRGEFATEQLDGETYYIHQDARTRGYRSGNMHLLPAYDEYIISYKSRHHALPPAYAHRAHNKMGIFWPIIYADGMIVGNWNGKMEYTWFAQEHSAMQHAEERFKQFKR